MNIKNNQYDFYRKHLTCVAADIQVHLSRMVQVLTQSDCSPWRISQADTDLKRLVSLFSNLADQAIQAHERLRLASIESSPKDLMSQDDLDRLRMAEFSRRCRGDYAGPPREPVKLNFYADSRSEEEASSKGHD